MRPKLCLGCSLAGAGLYLLFSLQKFCCPLDIQQLHVTKMSFCDKIISLPLVSGIMLL